MPLLPARPAAAPHPQRPLPGRRLLQPLAGRRPREIPRLLGQTHLQLSDPLPRQLRQRLRKLPAQRHHQCREHPIRRALISRHTRTLQLRQAQTPARDEEPARGSALSQSGRMAELTSYVSLSALCIDGPPVEIVAAFRSIMGAGSRLSWSWSNPFIIHLPYMRLQEFLRHLERLKEKAVTLLLSACRSLVTPRKGQAPAGAGRGTSRQPRRPR